MSMADALQNSSGGLGFLGGLNSRRSLQTPADIARTRALADELTKQGTSYAPIGSWTQGVARLADALAGNVQASRAHDDTIAAKNYTTAQMLGGSADAPPNPYAAALTGSDPSSQPAAAPAQPSHTASAGGPDTFSRMLGAESGGQQFDGSGQPLTSPKGAVGIAQVMPGTAPEAAQMAGLPYDENRYRTDPAYNQALGKAYFDHQLSSFGGDPAMAAAAYNAGPGAVQQAVAKAQASGGNYLSYLPQETQAYVAKVAGGGQQQPASAPAAIASAVPAGGAMAPIPVGPAPQPGPGPLPDPAAGADPAAGVTNAVLTGPRSPTAPDPGNAGAGVSGARVGDTYPGQDGSTLFAQNGMSAQSAAGAMQPGQPAGTSNRLQLDPQRLLAVMMSPYADPRDQALAASLLSAQQNRASFATGRLQDGSLYERNNLTGEVKMLQEASPTQFADKFGNIGTYNARNPSAGVTPIGPQEMSPLTRPMSASELRAANLAPDAHVQINTKTGEISQIPGGSGDDTYSKQLTEGLGKAHAQLANGVEEAQTRSRDLSAMQGALQRIQANGGTTGGLGQQEILDLKKAVNNGAAAIGVTQPFGDLSDPEFLTKFNRQIAAAAASTGSNGGRVTNFALQNMLKANPGLELTPQGNQRLIGIQQQIEQRNIAVGQSIRDATADAYAHGQKVNPGDIEKLIRGYDNQNHITDPLTGQDLTKNPTLADLQAGGPGTAGPQNPGAGVAPQQGGSAAPVTSQQQYDALPHGSLYRDAQGNTRRKT